MWFIKVDSEFIVDFKCKTHVAKVSFAYINTSKLYISILIQIYFHKSLWNDINIKLLVFRKFIWQCPNRIEISQIKTYTFRPICHHQPGTKVPSERCYRRELFVWPFILLPNECTQFSWCLEAVTLCSRDKGSAFLANRITCCGLMLRSGPGREYGHRYSSGREKRTEWGVGGGTERRKAKAQVNPSWEERIHLCARDCQIVSTHLVLRVNPVVTCKYFSYSIAPQCKISIVFRITKEPNLKRKVK